MSWRAKDLGYPMLQRQSLRRESGQQPRLAAARSFVVFKPVRRGLFSRPLTSASDQRKQPATDTSPFELRTNCKPATLIVKAGPEGDDFRDFITMNRCIRRHRPSAFTLLLLVVPTFIGCFRVAQAWTIAQPRRFASLASPRTDFRLFLSSSVEEGKTATASVDSSSPSVSDSAVDIPYDYDIPEDAVVIIKPRAMRRLRELKSQQSPDKTLVLRMGVRSGGCSGMSYVMDFSSMDDVSEDDAVDEYSGDGIACVVDAKSLLYLYGLELDYSDQLIGGGFKFSNPNAEESCGCGSSFGV